MGQELSSQFYSTEVKAQRVKWPPPPLQLLVIEPGLELSPVSLTFPLLHKAASRLKINESIQKQLESTYYLAGTMSR